ncbi:putative sulfate/molybdate transporter [Hydrogenophaga sp.]|uniref:putative sulfate/molybdate transporter n=1 Tax=Hydrogenophaga sp. TaxID=1904254 RepID=UPI0025BADAA7|nr:putative sulfate/molybdate transporter [Hydrogenophaga sp.]MBT9465259.1 putative sulfate/molybdate transporter [Hydrogenophaga sp.]
MTPATEPSEALPAPQHSSDATWRGDLGGAMGDLGTLLPFLVGFIVVAGVQPSSILLAFGLSLVIVGWRFGVPMRVQPMKAVGAAALAHTVVGTNDLPAVLALAALITGVFWARLRWCWRWCCWGAVAGSPCRCSWPSGWPWGGGASPG